jgi:hypothetical protein
MNAEVQERFLSKIERSDDCWLWTGSLHSKGYGKMSVAGRDWLAHRLAYELFVGPIPPKLQLDHLCRVRRCVNPAHLEAVTTRENLLRGVGFAAVNAQKTHCPAGHPYTEPNLFIGPKGERCCRACNRRRCREYQLRHPERTRERKRRWYAQKKAAA